MTEKRHRTEREKEQDAKWHEFFHPRETRKSKRNNLDDLGVRINHPPYMSGNVVDDTKGRLTIDYGYGEYW